MMSLIFYGAPAMQGYLPFVFVDFVFSDIIDDAPKDELFFAPWSHITQILPPSWCAVSVCNEKSADCEV